MLSFRVLHRFTLHVVRRVRTAALQCHDVVNHVAAAGASRRARRTRLQDESAVDNGPVTSADRGKEQHVRADVTELN
jgi:fructose-1,6-bisphosphatase/inositol monophosphatase family enzyme